MKTNVIVDVPSGFFYNYFRSYLTPDQRIIRLEDSLSSNALPLWSMKLIEGRNPTPDQPKLSVGEHERVIFLESKSDFLPELQHSLALIKSISFDKLCSIIRNGKLLCIPYKYFNLLKSEKMLDHIEKSFEEIIFYKYLDVDDSSIINKNMRKLENKRFSPIKTVFGEIITSRVENESNLAEWATNSESLDVYWNIDINDDYIYQGFYYCEANADRTSFWRWSGPSNRSIIMISIPGEGYAEIVIAIVGKSLASIDVQGKILGSKNSGSKVADGNITIFGQIGPSLAKQGFVEVIINVSSLSIPSGASRLLGICVGRVNVRLKKRFLTWILRRVLWLYRQS